MDPLIYCSRCKMTVQTECPEKDHTTCSLFKSAEARKSSIGLSLTGLKTAGSKEVAEILGRQYRTDKMVMDTCNADEGHKDDTGKAPLDLLAPEFLTGTAMVLQFGAKKYDAYNWAKGMKWSRVFAALMRHLWAWWGGEDRDPETGMSHLWHAGCGLMFLMAYEQRGTGEDDRPT